MFLAVAIALLPNKSLTASKATLAREAAEYVVKRFSKESAGEGVEVLARKAEALAATHGDEALAAFRKVGPRMFSVVDDAGEQSGDVVRLMAKYGDDADFVIATPSRLAMFSAHGDDAAKALIAHGEIAEPLINTLGQPAAGALAKLSSQNARRLAMMAGDGELAKIGRTPELLAVVQRFPDKAMDFIWKNKGALATASVLAAFLANPQPFLDGTLEISSQLAEHAVGPLADVPAEIARGTNWTIIILAIVLLLAAWLGLKWRIWRKSVAGRSDSVQRVGRSTGR
jgi:hypothetical protein